MKSLRQGLEPAAPTFFMREAHKARIAAEPKATIAIPPMQRKAIDSIIKKRLAVFAKM